MIWMICAFSLFINSTIDGRPYGSWALVGFPSPEDGSPEVVMLVDGDSLSVEYTRPRPGKVLIEGRVTGGEVTYCRESANGQIFRREGKGR